MQFPRKFVKSVLGGGSALAPPPPAIVPEALIPQVQSPPLARTTADFSVGFIARGYTGRVRGRGLFPQGTSRLGGWSLAWVLELSAWPPQMVLQKSSLRDTGCERGHPGLHATPSGGGGSPETFWGGLMGSGGGGGDTKTIL